MVKFTLKIIWLNSSLGLAIEHVMNQGYSPLSSYFFWPHHDVWTQMQTELESKPWISNNDRIDLLNLVTLLINYWQDNKNIQSTSEVQKKFPELIFYEDY